MRMDRGQTLHRGVGASCLLAGLFLAGCTGHGVVGGPAEAGGAPGNTGGGQPDAGSGLTDAGAPSPDGGVNVTVDFTAHGYSTSDLSVGACISTYGNAGTNLIKGSGQATWKQYLQDLGKMLWRIPLYFHGGTVGSAAGGVHGGSEGAAYISAIKSIGGTPMIVVGGTTNDNDIQASDASSLVHFFNDGAGQNGGPVDIFVVGNEPDNGFGVGNYVDGGAGSSGFHNIVVAMRAATTRPLSIAGPALTSWATYKYAEDQQFIAADNADVDIMDFHKYGDGQEYDNLYRTSQYSDAVRWFRGQIAASFGSRAAQIAIQVGEYNYHPFYAGWADAFYTSRNLVHTASVIGHMLQEGGRAIQYSDSNGPIGLITDGSGTNGQPLGQFVRLPAYWGVSTWTGGAWARRFGSVMVATATNLPDLEVFATDNPKKIILINTSQTTDLHLVLEMKGTSSGTYSAFEYARGMNVTDFAAGLQFQAPVQRVSSAAYANGSVAVDVPWLSVVVLIVD